MSYTCEWWGRNGKRHQNWTSLQQDLKDKRFNLIGVEIKSGSPIWRFENLGCGRGGYNPFRIKYYNEDPLIELVLAAQMKKKLKHEKNKAKAGLRAKRV